MAPKQDVTWYDIPADVDSNYPGLSIVLEQVVEVYIGPENRVVVVLTSGRDHNVTSPHDTYEAATAARDKFKRRVASA